MSKTSTHLSTNRDLPDDEIKAVLARTRDELFRLHLGMHTNQVTSSAQLTTKRREIARLMTILNNRKNGIEKQGAPAAKPAEAAAEAPTTAPTGKKSKKKA